MLLDVRGRVGEKVHQGIFYRDSNRVSGLIALAKPYRIKASHRRRWKAATGSRPYANNNPYKFIDPDGRYSCTREGGTCSEKDSAKMDKYVDSMRTAQAKMKPGAAADRAGGILKAIGKAWDGNGVTLNFANLKGDALGNQVGKTLNIDDKAIKSFAGEMGLKSASNLAGGVIMHEGSHMIDSQRAGFKGNAYPTSGAERRLTEIRAYGTESAIHNVLGIQSGINAPGMSVSDRSSAIMNAAQGSYESACASGGWGCD